MERRTRFGIILLIGLIAGLSIYGLFTQLYGGGGTLARANVQIPASVLAASFEGNETLADSLYLYKIVSVSGVVRQLITDASGNTIARLAGDWQGKALVDCRLDSLYRQTDLPLRTGDSVTIRGTCAGRWVNVLLLQCIIEK